MSKQLLFLEFNEINFESIEYYCKKGLLPNLAALIKHNGWVKTRSESKYEQLEPWIQWVTAHTGRTLAEHRVFRLGDIVNHDLPQIWELLEEAGFRVGAISPMNAKHRLRAPAFFVPDPWTPTQVTARPRLMGLYEAIVQAVNDNSQSRLTIRSVLQLVLGLVSYARLASYPGYFRLASTARTRPWRKAIFLDLLLADVFLQEVGRTRPHFATLFLNAGAHIQHHYLFSADCYGGPHRNPEWYLRSGEDPVREVYEAYDRVLGAVSQAFPDARLMIATGLHQEPHGQVTYYWRLRRHAEFLQRVGVPFAEVQPRMSRDFLIVCDSPEQAALAQQRLDSAKTADGTPLFDVDNRGRDLFVMLTYPREIQTTLPFAIGNERYTLSSEEVAFVALKNGEHSGIGYFIDSARTFARESDVTVALAEIPQFVLDAFGLHSKSDRASALA